MDFGALESYEVRKRAEPVIRALEEVVPGVVNYDRWGCFTFLEGNLLNEIFFFFLFL